MKFISEFFLSENFQFLVVKFSIYYDLNRHVFITNDFTYTEIEQHHYFLALLFTESLIFSWEWK